MTKVYTVDVILDDEDGGKLPNIEQMSAILAHSTISEAIREATDGCAVQLSVWPKDD